MVKIDLKHPRCPYCHTAVLPSEDKIPCRRCMSWHHEECWEEHGRCSSCASPAAPARMRKTSKTACTCGGQEHCRLHFQLHCPGEKCDGKFQVPNKLSGFDISCQLCGETFKVPTWKGWLILTCAGGCGSTFKVSNSFAGKTIRCGNCDYAMVILP